MRIIHILTHTLQLENAFTSAHPAIVIRQSFVISTFGFVSLNMPEPSQGSIFFTFTLYPSWKQDYIALDIHFTFNLHTLRSM
jgi:hypothetical protein